MTESSETVDTGAAQGGVIGFPVGSLKFWVMSILTFNLYVFYWSYKNFVRLKVPSGKKISAGVYALFFPLSYFSLLKGFEAEAEKHNYEVHFRKYLLGWGYFILVTIAKFLDKGDQVVLGIIASLLSLWALTPLQKHLCKINEAVDKNADINSRFTVWNFVWIIGLWALVLFVF